MLTDIDSNHFRGFAFSLEQAIEKYGELKERELLKKQKKQVNKLVRLENEFRKTLIEHKWGEGVYESFIALICEEKKNILAARPYFRERQTVFTKRISKALKDKNIKAIYKFHFNYQFIVFVMNCRKWFPKSRIVELFHEISQIRTELIEMNLPLAISRARIFYNRTPKSQLSFMDLIQISCEGLMSAVDKFVPPFTKVFRSVAIGRMVGYFIEQYSETLIHFYPSDKRKIYRANKAIHKYADSVDFERLATEVNVDMDAPHCTTASEIADLMAAASCVSADTMAPNTIDPEAGDPVARFAAPEDTRPDIRIENRDARVKLSGVLERLSPFERKFLRLRGVDLEAIS